MTERLHATDDWLASRREEMIETISRLVAEPTENPPGVGLGRCANVLVQELDRLGLDPELIEITSDHTLEDPYIVRAGTGSGSKLLYFHGHFDVVPAQNRDQFIMKRENGWLIGRGTADMKGGIVSLAYGAAAAADLGFIDDGRIVIHLVPDEETGSVIGSGHLRQHNLIDPSAVAMITAEPSASSIWHAARGGISLKVSFAGREAHVGQASFGVNAFAHMMHVAQKVQVYADELSRRHTRSIMDSNDPLGSMVVVGGQSGSGANFNVVPAESFFTIDSRINPEEDLDAELERMQAIILEAAAEVDADVRIEVLQFQPPAYSSPDGSVAKTLARCVEEVRNEPARFEMCAGILENRWYSQLGIPAFSFGAGRLDVSHGPNEYVEEKELFRATAVYALLAGELLS